MMYKSGKRDFFALFLIWGRNSSIFYHLKYHPLQFSYRWSLSCGGSSLQFLICWVFLPYIWIEFCQIFFQHQLIWSRGFSSLLCNTVDYIVWFPRFELALHPQNKSTWSWCVILFIHCWVWFTSILLKICISIFMRLIYL